MGTPAIARSRRIISPPRRSDRRIRLDPLDLPIATILATDNARGVQGPDGLEERGLLVAHRFMVFAGWRVHHHVGEHLKHVVLNHVAERPGCIVEAAAVVDAERFRHGDLDASTKVRFHSGSNGAFANRV